MSVGQFNRHVTVLAFDGPDDGQGGQNEERGWRSVLTLWASVVPLSAHQLLQAGLLASEITHRMGCHYRADLLAERRALRVRMDDGPLFAVRSLRDVDGRRIALEADVVPVSEPHE